jgi:hypothetical protein
MGVMRGRGDGWGPAAGIRVRVISRSVGRAYAGEGAAVVVDDAWIAWVVDER